MKFSNLKKSLSFRHSLGKRVTVILLLLMLLMGILLASAGFFIIRNSFIDLYNDKLQDIVRLAAGQTDWEALEHFAATGEPDAYSEQLLSFYNHIKEHFTDRRGNTVNKAFLYLFIPGEDSLTYLIEAQLPEDDPAEIAQWGDVYEYGEFEYEIQLPDIRAGQASSGVHYMNDAISAWAPVFDRDGTLRAVVEMDYGLNSIFLDANGTVVPIMWFFLFFTVLIIALMILFMRKNVIAPLGRLTAFVNSYDHGTIDEALNQFRHDDEIKTMAASFQEMTFRIDRYIHDLTLVTAEKERIGAELNVATQIQADMLPRIFPPFPDRQEFDLFASMDPAKEVGGDFYDFFLMDDDHLALVMADVSGKGVPAALFMVIAKTMLKNRAQGGGGSPKDILADVNNQLCEGNDAELFVTVWLGILTISTGKLVSASAGHEYPAVYRNGQCFSLVRDKHGPPLATMEGLRFRETELELKPGDALFLYTDGVTEATNAAPELFGEQRMLDALNRHGGEMPEQILAGVRKEIDAFVADAPQFDDITMLCLQIRR